MRYLINVAEHSPPVRGVAQTQHYCEIKLATNEPDEAENIARSFATAFPIKHNKPGWSFSFKLVGSEEIDLLDILP